MSPPPTTPRWAPRRPRPERPVDGHSRRIGFWAPILTNFARICAQNGVGDGLARDDALRTAAAIPTWSRPRVVRISSGVPAWGMKRVGMPSDRVTTFGASSPTRIAIVDPIPPSTNPVLDRDDCSMLGGVGQHRRIERGAAAGVPHRDVDPRPGQVVGGALGGCDELADGDDADRIGRLGGGRICRASSPEPTSSSPTWRARPRG